MRPNGPKGEQNYETLEFEAYAAGYGVYHVGADPQKPRKTRIETRHENGTRIIGIGNGILGAIMDVVDQIRAKDKKHVG